MSKQVTGFTPAQWVLIDAANHMGFDKKHLAERLEEGRKLLATVQAGDEVAIKAALADADNSAGLAAAIVNIQCILDGRPVRHWVGLDAASSGPQLLSTLCKCVRGMLNTGVIGNDNVPDLYSALLKELLPFNPDATRNMVKHVTIPFVYGSNNKPREVFGEDGAKEYVKAYQAALPAAFLARKIALNAWDNEALFYEWTLPDGHTAHIKVTEKTEIVGSVMGQTIAYLRKANMVSEFQMFLPARLTHSYDAYMCRELTARADYNRVQVMLARDALNRMEGTMSEWLADAEERYVVRGDLSIEALAHVINGCGDMGAEYREALLQLVEDTLSYAPFKVRTIHDEFQCLPNGVETMKWLYNKLLQEAYQGSWIAEVLTKNLGVRQLNGLCQERVPMVEEAIIGNHYAIA